VGFKLILLSLSKMAQYDLTPKLIKYLDRHQVLNLLTSLQEKELYKKEDLLRSKLELVSKTKMVDTAAEEYRLLHNTDKVPKEMEELRNKVVADLEACNSSKGLLGLLMKEDLVVKLREESNFNFEYLSSEYSIEEKDLNELYTTARFQFDCGQYGQAAELLYCFRELSNNEEQCFWALWGKLSAEILLQNWEAAFEDLKELKEAIDKRVFTEHLQQLQQRTWLIHWSLFVWFSLENRLGAMIEFFFSDKLLNTIETNCPHILRYLAVASIINKRRKNNLNDVVRLLRQEKNAHSDPITEFLLAVYTEFDFELAHAKLKECEVVVKNDFFLDQEGIADDFFYSARLLIFETFCRVHNCISLDKLVSNLDIEGDVETELSKFIQDCRVEAEIDTKKKLLIITTSKPGTYQNITEFEKVKQLAARSRQVAAQVEKKYKDMM